MSGDDSGAAFLQMLRHGDAQNVIQRVDLALNAAAVFQVEKRIALGVKMSPVEITSERRKNTMLSPSVCALGA